MGIKFELSPVGKVVWEDRYAKKDETGSVIEKDVTETFRRAAKAIASKETDPEKWEEKFYDIMVNGFFCPAGRVLANSGTHYSQLLNCFVLPFENDSLESIMDTAKKMAVIFKYGGGIGMNYSTLRPAGSYIKGVNGHSCGVIGFVHMMSSISEVIEQGGSRRAASLGLLEVWHPDIWEFVIYKSEHNWERLQEFVDVKDQEKWRSFKHENFYKWQMYNVSVGVCDEFFEAVKQDEFWPLKWGNQEWELYEVRFKKFIKEDEFKSISFEVTAFDESVALWKIKSKIPFPTLKDKFEVVSKRRIKARELWDKICYAAWVDGCPGLINLSTARKTHNIEYISPLQCANPCFSGECAIETKEGYKKFKELENKSVDIVTPKGIESAKIWKTGERSTIRLKCSSLKEIIVTPDQVLMTSDRREIKAVDSLQERLNVLKESLGNFDLLWVKLGFIQGDGNLSRLKSKHRHKGLEINMGKKDKDIKDLFNYTGKGRSFYTTEYVSNLLKYGFSQEVLPYRCLPEDIPEDKELSFLRGLYSANGSIIKGARVSLKSTCKQLIDGVKALLNKYKIDSYYTTNKPKAVKFKNGEYLCRESYDLNISKIFSIVKFNELIGFHLKHRSESLLNLIKDKSPLVTSIRDSGVRTVYDFSTPSHWGCVDGIRVHNCGEQMLSDYSSCNLSSIILSSFVDKKGAFDFEKFKEVIHVAARFGDNVIDNSVFPIPEIEKKAMDERRVGVGPMGVHDTLIAMELGYDTDEGRKFIEKVMIFMRDEIYKASINLAKERGPFPLYNKKKYLKSGFVKTLPVEIRESIGEFGIRNSTLLTIAPSGSISTLFGVSSGCEPWFSLSFQRNTKLGSYEDGCSLYLKWVKEHKNEPKPFYFKTAQEISPEDHVKMLVLLSSFIDSSISKTVNLSNSATVKDVKDVFIFAMENGAKGLTVFRDGCKEGVLINKDKIKGAKKVVHDLQDMKEEITESRMSPKKRGGKTVGSTTRIHMRNHNVYITVNRNADGKLVEVFATVGENKNESTLHTSGVEDSWAEGLAKMISLALRAGVGVESIIRNLKNIPSDKPVFTTVGDNEVSEHIPSPPHAIARAIEEEMLHPSVIGVKAMVLTKPQCANCGMNNTVPKSSTCYTCLDCGFKLCG